MREVLRPGPRASAIAVAALAALGLVIRLKLAGDSLFADELSTAWVVSGRGLGGVLAVVHTDAEITPPLFFVLSWLSTRLGHAPELLRAPSLVAGVATIPLIYLLGLRTVGRRPALVASALTALSPFMIFYSVEARGYALMMALVTLSTLALLAALDSARARWWAVYAVATCGAVYSHYTCVFVLGAQLLWVLYRHPSARKAAVLATAGAVVGFLPWTSGVINDFGSPTTKILSALEPFTPHYVRISLEHWAVGYPFVVPPSAANPTVSPGTGLNTVPGSLGLSLFAAGVLVGIAGVIAAVRGTGLRATVSAVNDRFVLVALLALSVPVGEALVSTTGTHLLGIRNLAASWPAFVLALAGLLSAAGRRLGAVASALAVLAFGLGATKLLDHSLRRPDYQQAARYIRRAAGPGDVVLEAAILSPGPLTGLDAAGPLPVRVLRLGRPQERDHPFNIFDPVPSNASVSRRAGEQADGHRVFLVTTAKTLAAVGAEVRSALPPGYRAVSIRHYPGLLPLVVALYARS